METSCKTSKFQPLYLIAVDEPTVVFSRASRKDSTKLQAIAAQRIAVDAKYAIGAKERLVRLVLDSNLTVLL